MYLELQRWGRAEEVFNELTKRNPENTLYYKKLIEAKQLTDVDDIVDLFESYQKQFPRALAPRRLPLNYAVGRLFCVIARDLILSYLKLVQKYFISIFIILDERFKDLVDGYLKKGLHKGVPPLFVHLRSLYKNPSKAATIQALVLSYVNQLKETGHFSKHGEFLFNKIIHTAFASVEV